MRLELRERVESISESLRIGVTRESVGGERTASEEVGDGIPC
jgi:hypothetical protein